MTQGMTVVGTRPHIIRLWRVIPRLDDTVDHHLMHTGQNYDPMLNEVFFSGLGVRKPDRFFGILGPYDFYGRSMPDVLTSPIPRRIR